MSPETRLQRDTAVVARRIGGETILVPVTRRAQEMGLFTLDEVGTFVWERLDGQTPLAAIALAISESFDVDAERAGADLGPFAEMLERTGCVREVGR